MKQTISIPDGWSDISIEILQEINSAKTIADKISIIIDQDPEDIRKYDTESFNKISNALSWIHQMPEEESYKKIITIDGVDYGLMDKFSDLLSGEWMDIEEYCKSPIDNLHKIMAMFYRPLLTTLKNGTRILDDYNVKEANERADLFKSKMSIADCYGTLVFFSLIGNESLKTIQVYFQLEILKMKIQEEKQKVKESKGSLKKRKLPNGLGGRFFTLFRRATSSK